jgi:PAS domain-containing protein
MVVSSVGLALLVISEASWKASGIGLSAAALAVAVTALGSGLLIRAIYAMQQSAEARRLSEEQFHQLVAGVTDYAIYMLDREGRITTWNLGAERIKGYSAAEIVGQNFSRLLHAGGPGGRRARARSRDCGARRQV